MASSSQSDSDKNPLLEASGNAYSTEDTDWNIVIRPKAAFFSLNLKEVWQYRDLMWLFVKRDFVAKYKQTVLGPLWHLIQPALTTAMAVFLFNRIANIGTDGKNAVLFQMAGTVIWAFFSVCLTSTAGTFTSNASIFGKVYFPRIISPISVVISNIVQLGIMLMLLIATMVFYFISRSNPDFELGAVWVVPIVVFILAGISLGLGVIFSSLTTKYRDMAVLVTFGVQLLGYASAVQYPLSVLMEKTVDNPWLYSIVKWNPLSVLVEAFRNAMLGGTINYGMIGYSFVFMVVALFLGMFVFNKVEKTFMDTV